MADTPYGCAVIQRYLDRLENWTEKNLTMFSKGKCKVLNLHLQQYMMGSD